MWSRRRPHVRVKEMGLFSKKKQRNSGATVAGMVARYLQVKTINPSQLAALTEMARSLADKKELERLNEAIRSEEVEYSFSFDRRF